jgi:ArsR family metal-binding transcriptional regulator
MGKLITNYEYERVPNPHDFGSLRYGLKIILLNDISQVFPYLNTVLDDTLYDHENRILIGIHRKQRYAFRPNEIQIASANDPSTIMHQIEDVINLINRTWDDHDRMKPCTKERSTPAVYDIFKLLPKSNCRECGYPTCLAFAAELRKDTALLENCPPLSQTENEKAKRDIVSLFSLD